MAPTIQPFHPADLEKKLLVLPTGKPRKPSQHQNLLDCQLKELVQFDCQVRKDVKFKGGLVVCEPIVRVFRRCKDGLTVETTAWETEN